MTTSSAPSGATDAVVAFALDSSYDHQRTHALVRTLVDTVAVALAGAESDELAAVSRWADANPSPGSAPVWGRAVAVSPSRAALLNGTAAHSLDFDDASPTTPMHPSAVLWPAVLAQASVLGSSWHEALAAVDVGQAVIRAVGEVLPGDTHYDRGWHTTSTVGRLAATAALARLGGLTADRTRSALGLAATTASGLLAGFGTMAKPLHVGFAARDAVDAVDLATHGVTADLAGVDTFVAVYGAGARDAGARLDAALARWSGTWPTDVSVKRYPSCYGTHRAVDAALDVRERLGAGAAASSHVLVEVHPASLRPLVTHSPTSPLEAKFSLEHTVASALVDGSLALDSFTEEAVTRADVVALRERVVVVAGTAPPGGPDLHGAGYARVRADVGIRSESALVTVTRGDARNPVPDDELDRKLLGCATAAGWTSPQAERLLAALRAASTTTSPVEAFEALRRTGEAR